MFQIDVTIINQKRLSSDCYIIEFISENIAKSAKPGQFIHIHCPAPESFFRRPFSIADINKNIVSIYYKRIGPGTKYLSSRKKGDTLNIIGPLGKGYPDNIKGKNIVFVAGGTGIASLNFLAKKLQPSKGKLFYGAKCKAELVFANNFNKKNWQTFKSTDDGSAGFKGFVSDLFFNKSKNILDSNTVVFMCGPHKLERAVALFLIKNGISFYVSMESVFACGLGVCQGCAIKKNRSEGYFLACKDGPVFPGNEIDWKEV
ncbi:MAG: dihydroorotate dehydrogenase electron transfer subunit [bacterium]